jgi:pilus assembly protein Flp/PilA
MNALSILTAKIVSFRSDRRAVTALEYGLIASLVALAIVAGITLLGTNLGLEFTNIAGRV